MQSVKEIYKIGNGPSSSHTMGPAKAASIFKERNPGAAANHVTLYGSLAATGKGHLTDKALLESLAPTPSEISWKASETIPPHPNGMTFRALDAAGSVLQEWTTFSIGGGDISDSGTRESANCVYEMSTMKEILEHCEDMGCSFWEYVEEREGPGLWEYLGEVWQAMQEAIARGLETEGMFNGGSDREPDQSTVPNKLCRALLCRAPASGFSRRRGDELRMPTPARVVIGRGQEAGRGPADALLGSRGHGGVLEGPRGRVMPVRRYRDVGEMDRDIWYERGDPRLFKAIRAVWNFAHRIVQPGFPPGVHRFRSIEDASEQRRLWEDRTLEAMQRRMKPSA